MKSIPFLCVLMTLIVALSCCKKEAEIIDGSTGSITFKYDTTKNFQSTYSSSVWEPNNSLLNITAKGGKSFFVINVAMPNGIKTGTYSFSRASAAAAVPTVSFFREDTAIVTQAYFSDTDTQTGGSLVITSISADSLLTGTFTLTLKDPVTGKTKKLTEGTITAVKVINNKSIVTGGTNTFSAKIDGVLWSPKQITGSKNFGKIILNASDGTKAMGFQLVETIKVGAYTLDWGSDYHGQYNPNNLLSNPESYVALPTTSKLTITEHNTTTRQIKGTFNFKGDLFPVSSPKSYLITEGGFSIKY